MTPMSIQEYLGQEDFWLSVHTGDMKINEMSPVQRVRAARWLLSRAQPLISLMETAMHESMVADEGKYGLEDILGLMDENPRVWMELTPLYRALSKGLNI